MFHKNLSFLASAILAFFPCSHTLASSGFSTQNTSQDSLFRPDYNLPNLGTVAGADLSLKQEREYGEEIMLHMRKDPSYLTDSETSDYLNRLGYRLIAASQTQPYDFFFFPVRDKSLNAFALPGGFVAVHSGLIVSAQTESELAGVLGHEIGHVTQRHIARMIEQSQGSLAMTVGSILLAILAARAGGGSGGNAAMAISLGTQAAMIQRQLAYSRDAEREADRVGLSSLTNAGFDPHGMESFFEKLQRNNRYYESASLAYLSTHPLSVERIGDMKSRTMQLPIKTVRDSLDFKLIQARMRVLQETRYDGWLSCTKIFQEGIDKLPSQAAAAAHYGLSVAFQKMNQKEKALTHARMAMNLAHEQNIILEKHLSEIIFETAKTTAQKEEALRISLASAQRYPYSSMIAISHAQLLYRSGKNDDVIRYLRNQRAISRNDTDYYSLSARSYEALGKRSLAYVCTGDMYFYSGNLNAALYQYELAQKASDADFYVMSEIDAKLRNVRQRIKERKRQ